MISIVSNKALVGGEPWYEKVKRQIPKESYKICATGLQLSQIGEFHISALRKVKEGYQELKRSPIGSNVLTKYYKDTSFTMASFAIVATYLMHKHQISGIVVCQSLEAFQNELRKYAASQEEGRRSFIIPTRYYDPKERSLETQHMVCIGVEKTKDRLKIVVFESGGIGIEDISADIVTAPAKDLVNQDINEDETIFWYLIRSGIDLQAASLYMTTIKRQNGNFGCETCSLRDAILFLQCPDFFDRAVVGMSLHIDRGVKVDSIVALPPSFMKITQSRQVVTKYLKKYEELAKTPFIRKTEENITSFLERHKIVYQTEKREQVLHGYLEERVRKYKRFALEAVRTMDPDTLQALIEVSYRTLKASPFNPAKIETINDLHHSLAVQGLPEWRLSRL